MGVDKQMEMVIRDRAERRDTHQLPRIIRRGVMWHTSILPPPPHAPYMQPHWNLWCLNHFYFSQSFFLVVCLWIMCGLSKGHTGAFTNNLASLVLSFVVGNCSNEWQSLSRSYLLGKPPKSINFPIIEAQGPNFYKDEDQKSSAYGLKKITNSYTMPNLDWDNSKAFHSSVGSWQGTFNSSRPITKVIMCLGFVDSTLSF